MKRLVSSQLEADFSEEEIASCLWECNDDKAPGPDGFNLKSIWEFWSIIKDDVFDIFKEFHNSGSFIKALNATFLVLISKIGAKTLRSLGQSAWWVACTN